VRHSLKLVSSIITKNWLLDRFGPGSVVQHDFSKESLRRDRRLFPNSGILIYDDYDLSLHAYYACIYIHMVCNIYIYICIVCNQKIQIWETFDKLCKFKKHPKTNHFWRSKAKVALAGNLGSIMVTRFHERPRHRGHRNLAAGATDLDRKNGWFSFQKRSPRMTEWYRCLVREDSLNKKSINTMFGYIINIYIYTRWY